MDVHGPNVNRLIIHKASVDAVPTGKGIEAALSFLIDSEKRKAGLKAAEEWVMQAIAVVKTAPDNTFADDEAIAGEILRRLKEKENAKRQMRTR